MPLDRLDPIIERAEVGGLDSVPDGTDGMVVGNEFIERVGLELDLIALSRLKPRTTASLGLIGRLRRAGLLGDLEQQGLAHGPVPASQGSVEKAQERV
jgi:hypothetical protein